jgi:hypothetical protein
MTLFVLAAAFMMAAGLALGFAGDVFFVTFVALGLMTLGAATFFAAAFLGAIFLVAFFFFFGVERMTSSIRRSGFPGSLFVSERVFRVDCGTVAARRDLALDVYTEIRRVL